MGSFLAYALHPVTLSAIVTLLLGIPAASHAQNANTVIQGVTAGMEGGTTEAEAIELFGVTRSAEEHLQSMLEGRFWAESLDEELRKTPGVSRATPENFTAIQRYLYDCENAREIVRAPDTANPARNRLAAIQTFRSCLQNGRARLNATAAVAVSRTATAFQADVDMLNRAEDGASAETEFMGLSFGLGVGASFSGDDRISEAEIGADGNIRAIKDETQEPRVIFESHYYGWCRTDRCNAGEFGIGPFFGIVAKDDKLISAFALGMMLGWKSDYPTDKRGFSIGLGAILDADVSSLADGFEVGQPLPAGEDAPAFKTESRWGALLFFTRTF